jgi:Tfp pilus assembly protein PilN
MIKINLNPQKRKKEQVKVPSIKFEGFNELFYFIPAILFVVIAIIFTMYENQAVNSLKEEKAKLLTEKQKYKSIENKINTLNKKYANLKDTLNQIEMKKLIYKEFSKQKEDFNSLFEIAYNSIPDGVWLDYLYISRSKFEFNGYSLNPLNISYFYKNLSKYFENVNFKTVERKSNKLNSFYSFKFTTSQLMKGGNIN